MAQGSSGRPVVYRSIVSVPTSFLRGLLGPPPLQQEVRPAWKLALKPKNLFIDLPESTDCDVAEAGHRDPPPLPPLPPPPLPPPSEDSRGECGEIGPGDEAGGPDTPSRSPSLDSQATLELGEEEGEEESSEEGGEGEEEAVPEGMSWKIG